MRQAKIFAVLMTFLILFSIAQPSFSYWLGEYDYDERQSDDKFLYACIGAVAGGTLGLIAGGPFGAISGALVGGVSGAYYGSASDNEREEIKNLARKAQPYIVVD